MTAPTRRTVVAAALGVLALGLGGCAAPVAEASPGGVPVRDRRRAVQMLIIREAASLRVSPALALAVAHAESNFDPRAESHKGARGVMQIMPQTALGEYAIHPDRLWDARINVRLGLHFLRRLIERYDGRIEYALSYYNGGSRVGPPHRPRIIPATRPYVAKVLKLRDRYRRALARGAV
jgi:soluble lytic murein transglycosylase-like protein